METKTKESTESKKLPPSVYFPVCNRWVNTGTLKQEQYPKILPLHRLIVINDIVVDICCKIEDESDQYRISVFTKLVGSSMYGRNVRVIDNVCVPKKEGREVFSIISGFWKYKLHSRDEVPHLPTDVVVTLNIPDGSEQSTQQTVTAIVSAAAIYSELGSNDAPTPTEEIPFPPGVENAIDVVLQHPSYFGYKSWNKDVDMYKRLFPKAKYTPERNDDVEEVDDNGK